MLLLALLIFVAIYLLWSTSDEETYTAVITSTVPPLSKDEYKRAVDNFTTVFGYMTSEQMRIKVTNVKHLMGNKKYFPLIPGYVFASKKNPKLVYVSKYLIVKNASQLLLHLGESSKWNIYTIGDIPFVSRAAKAWNQWFKPAVHMTTL